LCLRHLFFNLCDNIFFRSGGGEKLIVTTKESAKATMDLTPNAKEFMKEHRISFAVLDIHNGRLSPTQICRYLKNEKNINHMEITAGSNVIGQFLNDHLIDETRITRTGSIFGHMNSEGIPRPLFGQNVYYNAENHPLLEYQHIRLFGKYHLFMRGKWIYRNTNHSKL